ncbi:uncharacterized protein T551_02696 [Pneumocystis jirovecii RU7]|uniref:F-box domain-containing protein n=1 Tax=Pneumocystis jirovecii (strain RU7) TaxID=1408657 RepID=A0A0W4ZIU2_PNEJ7|nr:uncharacterized protein T551_02696 [Pneumocystis jirovecii RU7]KTW28277.1 hypothetical protein T551_02696 [Pneumocystis jirovecii RU7]
METPLLSNSTQPISVKNNQTCMTTIPGLERSSHTCYASESDKMVYTDAPTVAKFSFGPITHTTVVTTTTTTTTNFPPIVFYPPKKKHDFDSKQYPLYNVPTPACLKRFCFDIDGKPAYFRESEDPYESLQELQKDIERLKKNNEVTITITENYDHPLKQKTTELIEKEKKESILETDSSLSESFQTVHTNSTILYQERQTSNTLATSKDESKYIRKKLSSDIETKSFHNTNDTLSLNISNNDNVSAKNIHNLDLDKNIHRNNINDAVHDHIISNDLGDFQNQSSIESNLSSHQFLPLPSPSLSPRITTLNYANESCLTTEKNGLNTPETISDESEKSTHEQIDPKEINNVLVLSGQGNSIIRIPEILNIFDNLPPNVQTYLIHHLLRRCNKTTLQVVASVVNPALKRDFLALLPFELALNILKDLDIKSLCRASQVSKKWKQIVDTDEWIWKLRFEADGFKLRENELDQVIYEGWHFQHISSNNTSFRMLKEIKNIPCTNSNITFSKIKKFGKFQNIQDKKYTPIECQGTTEKHFEEIKNKENHFTFPKQYLFKTLYKKHHIIRKNWMNPNIKPRHISFRGHGRNVVTCLQFDADKIITGSDDSSINVYDTSTGRLRRRLQGHEGGVWALQYLGNTLVSGSTDRTVRVWDIAKGECTQIFEGHISTVRCLQILTSINIEVIHNGIKKQINTSLIVTGSRDSTLRVWRLPQPGDAHYRPSPPSSPNEATAESTSVSINPYYIRTLIGHTNSVRAVSGYNNILVSGSYDSTVRVWRVSTGECIWRLVGHSQKVYSVVIDPKRNRCVSGSMDWKVKVWSLKTGTCLWTLEGHSSLVGLLDLSYDYLVSAAADSTLRIWDPDTGKCIHVLSAHTGAITCFQHDENKVISGSDGLLKMWDVRTGRFVTNILTDLSGVWQVRFDERRCVAAVQRDHVTYIEVLDFGAAADGVPEEERGRRIVVDNTILMDDLIQINSDVV